MAYTRAKKNTHKEELRGKGCPCLLGSSRDVCFELLCFFSPCGVGGMLFAVELKLEFGKLENPSPMGGGLLVVASSVLGGIIYDIRSKHAFPLTRLN